MKQITVGLGSRSTKIQFVARKEAEEALAEAGAAVFDANTAAFAGGYPPAQSVVIPPGELSKNWESAERIITAALNSRVGRDDTIAGVGGGVVCDVAGFAASIYMRGTRLDLIPTSLLAMTDAAVGGKTGIDYGGLKNMIGTFYPAENVYIAVEYLSSLPLKEYRCGLAEIIKHALLGGKDLFRDLKVYRKEILGRCDPGLIEDLLYRSLLVKKGFVEEDFLESGSRAFLNLGHTFGHSLESEYGFQSAVDHGSAVVWGIVAALKAGKILGITGGDYVDEVEELIQSCGFTLTYDYDPDRLIDSMSRDKKLRGGKVRFVLQRELGNTFQSELSEDVLRRVLTEMKGY